MKTLAGLIGALLGFILTLAVVVFALSAIGYLFLAAPPRGPLVPIVSALVLGLAAAGARYGWDYGQKLLGPKHLGETLAQDRR